MKHIYLDNAGSTKVSKNILESFNNVCDNYYANSSASHTLGNNSKQLFKEARKQIASLCVVKEDEVFFTSGATESINTAIKGIALRNMKRKNHIVTTSVEHPATIASLEYLSERFDFEISYVKPIDGEITAEMILAEVKENTALVTLIHVQSETGMILPIEEVAKELKDIPIHVDACQSFGKIKIDFDKLDLVSISMHKLYGLKGSGLLIKKSSVALDSLVHGGNQQEIRSGTIPLEMCVCAAKTVRVALENIDEDFKTVETLSNKLKSELDSIEECAINSVECQSPYILNFSLLNVNVSAISRLMWEDGVYFATKTSCASNDDFSPAIYDLTNDIEKAKNSIRVSLSKHTTDDDIKILIARLNDAITRVRGNECG